MVRLIDLDVLKEHFADHLVMAKGYIDSTNRLHQTDLFINEASLYLAVKSAYDDIERYKLYHQKKPSEQKSNAVKRVAYLTKWLMKTKPIHCRHTPGDHSNIIPLLSNAGMCLAFARTHISAELSQEFCFTIKSEFELIYDLTYRELGGDALLAMFQNYYDLVRGIPLLEDLKPKKFGEPSE